MFIDEIMNSMKKIAIVILLLFFSPLCAHDLYLSPEPPILKKPEKIQLSMFLLKDHVQWLSVDTVSFKMFGPEGESEIQDPPKDSDNATAAFSKEGTHVIGWECFPIYIKLDPVTFRQYIVLDGYGDVLKARKEAGQDNAIARERYTRFVKTFIQVGAPRTDHYNKVFGYKIEIIPLSNPYSLKIGSRLDVKVLFNGLPLPGQKIMATYDSYSEDPNQYAQTSRTNDEGIASFQMTTAGFWLIRCSHMIALHGDPYANWESFWANISFAVPED
jgi:hypothetical protein